MKSALGLSAIGGVILNLLVGSFMDLQPMFATL